MSQATQDGDISNVQVQNALRVMGKAVTTLVTQLNHQVGAPETSSGESRGSESKRARNLGNFKSLKCRGVGGVIPNDVYPNCGEGYA